jgi:sialic acid synthase SpsE
MGKQLVAARALAAGHVLADGDLVAKSPADGGLPPYALEELLGRPLVRELAEEEAVAAADVGDPSSAETLSRAGSRPA